MPETLSTALLAAPVVRPFQFGVSEKHDIALASGLSQVLLTSPT